VCLCECCVSFCLRFCCLLLAVCMCFVLGGSYGFGDDFLFDVM